MTLLHSVIVLSLFLLRPESNEVEFLKDTHCPLLSNTQHAHPLPSVKEGAGVKWRLCPLMMKTLPFC